MHRKNPVSNIQNAKLYEVQKYLSLTGHTYDPNIYFINKKFFDSLPGDLQQVLKDTAYECCCMAEKSGHGSRGQDS